MRTPTKHVAKSGRVTWRVKYRVPTRDGARDGSASQTFKTRNDADRFAQLVSLIGPDAALDQVEAANRAGGVPTMDQVAASHIRLLTDVTDGTRLNYRRLWDRTWSPLLGNVPATGITRDRIAEAVNVLAKAYSAKSLRNQRGLLASVCKRAVLEGHLPANPVDHLRLPRSKEAEREDLNFLTPDEFDGIVSRVPDHYRAFVRFLGGTGCRWGEAVALQVGDVAFHTVPPSVRVRRALSWSPDNARTIGPTKTKKSNRTVGIPSNLVDELRQLTEGRAKGERLFSAPKGGPVHHRTFWSDVWFPAVKDMDPRPRLHDIRHSHASWLLGRGVPIHVVQARLGHSDITTTVGTYGHLMPDAQMLAASAAELVFAPRQIEG